MDNGTLLHSIVEIMERKDHEIRLLDVRLPPYNSIVQRWLEKLDNLTIEEHFVDELRQLSGDEMSERLNSADETVRARPAADMRCFIHLVDHVVKRTRFRKKIRLLKVAQALEKLGRNIEEFYHSIPDAKKARHQSEQFLNRRLLRLFSDVSSDESKEIKQRSTALIDTIEQKILGGRQNAVEGNAPPPMADGSDDESELS